MSHRSLIIFAKLPRAGEVKTRLGQTIGMREAVERYKSFAEHAFSLANTFHAWGVRISIFFAPGASRDEITRWVGRPFEYVEQRGNDLGARMQNAFDATFSDGAEQSVIIGTDVPELDVATIQSAFAALAKNDIVIGPSDDGGYYLLGMNAPTKLVFDGVQWSSSSVFSQTLQHVVSLGLSYQLLPVFHDIDTVEDLRKHINRSSQ